MAEESVTVKIRNPYVEHPCDLILTLDQTLLQLKEVISREYPGTPSVVNQKLIHGGKVHPDETTLRALISTPGPEEVEESEPCLVFSLMLPNSVTKQVQDIVSPRILPQQAPPEATPAMNVSLGGNVTRSEASDDRTKKATEHSGQESDEEPANTLSALAMERKKRADAALRRVSHTSSVSVSGEEPDQRGVAVQSDATVSQFGDVQNQAAGHGAPTRTSTNGNDNLQQIHSETIGRSQQLPSTAVNAGVEATSVPQSAPTATSNSPTTNTATSPLDQLLQHHQSIQALLTHQLHLSHQLGSNLGFGAQLHTTNSGSSLDNMSDDLAHQLHPTLDNLRHRHHDISRHQHLERYRANMLHATARLQQAQLHQTIVAQQLYHQDRLRTQAKSLFSGLTPLTPVANDGVSLPGASGAYVPSAADDRNNADATQPAAAGNNEEEAPPPVQPRPRRVIQIRLDLQLIIKMLFVYYLFGYNASEQGQVGLISMMVVYYLYQTGLLRFLGLNVPQSGESNSQNLLSRIGGWVLRQGQVPSHEQEHRAFTDIRCIITSFILSMIPMWQVLQVPVPDDAQSNATVNVNNNTPAVDRQDNNIPGARDDDLGAPRQPQDQPVAAV